MDVKHMARVIGDRGNGEGFRSDDEGGCGCARHGDWKRNRAGFRIRLE